MGSIVRQRFVIQIDGIDEQTYGVPIRSNPYGLLEMGVRTDFCHFH